ncbi:MAG: hypothetical protein R3B48_29605 [Kofleriaceae bacterium]
MRRRGAGWARACALIVATTASALAQPAESAEGAAAADAPAEVRTAEGAEGAEGAADAPAPIGAPLRLSTRPPSIRDASELPAIIVEPPPPPRDTRKVAWLGGLLVLAAMFLWNRHRRLELERADAAASRTDAAASHADDATSRADDAASRAASPIESEPSSASQKESHHDRT